MLTIGIGIVVYCVIGLMVARIIFVNEKHNPDTDIVDLGFSAWIVMMLWPLAVVGMLFLGLCYCIGLLCKC